MRDGTADARPALAVIVVTYNSASYLADLLGSITTTLRPDTYELVVSDNGSSDATVKVVRSQCPQARVIENHANLGYSAAINAALRTVDASLPVLVLNPDIRLTEGAVDQMLDAAARDPKAGIIAPRLVDEAGQTRRSLQREPSLPRELGTALGSSRLVGGCPRLSETVYTQADYESPRYIDWVTGAALLVTAPARAAVGAWDESYFLYSEEIDFAHRVRAADLKVRYEPTAVVVHHEGASGESPALWSLAMINKHRYYARRHNRLASCGYFAALLLRCITRLWRPTYRAALAALLHYGRSGPARSIEALTGTPADQSRSAA